MVADTNAGHGAWEYLVPTSFECNGGCPTPAHRCAAAQIGGDAAGGDIACLIQIIARRRTDQYFALVRVPGATQ
jgi:hypothetical protein